MIVNDAPEMGELFGVDGFKADNRLLRSNEIEIALSINTY
jgi:hypothetical protein